MATKTIANPCYNTCNTETRAGLCVAKCPGGRGGVIYNKLCRPPYVWEHVRMTHATVYDQKSWIHGDEQNVLMFFQT
jgi:hypothetical protein